MILQLYRKDYDGEFVIVKSSIVGGKRINEKEWIDNPIINQHISGRAAIIASGESRLGFNVKMLEKHRGGLLVSKKLQTYGTGSVYRDMRVDFFITVDTKKLEECIALKYTEAAVVYTLGSNCMKYPGEFYLIPHNVKYTTGAMAVWLAAFDGHKEIFLLGFDGQQQNGYNNNIYISSDDPAKNIQPDDEMQIHYIKTIMNTYPEIQFYRVSGQNKVDTQTPEEWKWCLNFKEMTYQEWISYCDI